MLNGREDIIRDLVERLPKLRKTYGVSQEDLGELIGVSRQTISAIERKATPLTWTTALAILMVFMVNNDGVYYLSKRMDYTDSEMLKHALAIKKTYFGKKEMRN